MSLGSFLRACRPRSLSRISGSRFFCSDRSDAYHGTGDKFGWMDYVLENSKINDVSGNVKLEEHHWTEFVNTGFISDTEEITEESNESSMMAQEISQEDIQGWFDIDENDLSEMFKDSEVHFQIEEFSTRESFPHPQTGQEIGTSDPGEVLLSEQRGSRNRELNTGSASVDNKLKTPFSLSGTRLSSLDKTLNGNAAKLPKIHTNKKKPGKEKRVMRQESEMGRIIEKLISTRFTEWNKQEANVTHVVLSPNMQNLSVYYHVPGNAHRTTRWKKLIKNITRSSRAEIAKLHSRYAPQVKFCYGRTQDEDGLDGIFDQIAKERQEAGKHE